MKVYFKETNFDICQVWVIMKTHKSLITENNKILFLRHVTHTACIGWCFANSRTQEKELLLWQREKTLYLKCMLALTALTAFTILWYVPFPLTFHLPDEPQGCISPRRGERKGVLLFA